MDIRVGHGYDLHRLEPKEHGGKTMVVGGVPIDCSVGPIAHSDGDAVMHAITDAVLSAIGSPDLGTIFPNNAAENQDRESEDFLSEAISRANEVGWAIGNIDITVLCDEPNIGPHREQICKSLRDLTGAPINIKGKTHEAKDRSGVIEVHVVAIVQRGAHR